ncbi:MAG: DUF4956 domain-containing protein [Bacteroidota bacterium]
MIRFVIHLVFLIILIWGVYFKYSKKEKFLFTFFLMGVVVFFITAMLKSVFIEIGMAFGLFAIFAILRFRTRNFSLKDMSYIFTVIGISVINSLKLVGFPVLGVIIFNIIIISTAIILERFTSRHNIISYTIIYENLDLLRYDRNSKLLKDVSEITGKDIMKVKIVRINYKKKVAELEIFYKD